VTATAGRILGRAVGYLTQIYLARLLAPEGFGLFAIGWTLLRLFSIAGHLGLDFGVIKFGSKYWQRDTQKLRNVVLMSLAGAVLSGVICGSALYVSAPWMAGTFFQKPDLKPILQSLAIAFPFATALRVMAAAGSLSGKMFGGAVIEDIAQPVLQLALFFFLFDMKTPIDTALLSTVISYGLSVLLGTAYVAWVIPGLLEFKPVSFADIPALFQYSLAAILGVTLGAFNLWGDRLLVGYFGTETDTGIYQSISVITIFTTIVLSGLKISVAPMLAAMHHDGDLAGIQALARSVTRWALCLCCPILLTIFLYARTIIVGIFGIAYESGTTALLILTVGQLFYVGFGLIDQIFLMSGGQRQWLQISVLVFVLTVLLDAVLVPRLHVIGASLVSSAMMLLMGCISVMTLRHLLQFWLFNRFHIRIIVAMVLTGLIMHLTGIKVETILGLGTAAFLITCLFGLLLFALGLEQSDSALLRKVFRK